MNQTSLDRAVARLTGESVRRIKSMGFSLVAAPRQLRVLPRRSAQAPATQAVRAAR